MRQELRKEVGALRGQSQQSVAEVRHLQAELEKATQSCSQRQSHVEELRGESRVALGGDAEGELWLQGTLVEELRESPGLQGTHW